MSSTSITSQKQAFLRTQIRHLSAPLTVPDSIHSQHDSGPLPNKVVTDLIAKGNAKIKSHNSAVYSSASQRHVAEQIESLYWNKASRSEGEIEKDTTVLVRNIELSDTKVLQSLPEEFNDVFLHPNEEADEGASETYRTLRNEVLALAEERDDLRRRLGQYRRLQELLHPFENAQENVQPNLVTRDGDMGREVEKMRVLLARVQGKIAEGTGSRVNRNTNGVNMIAVSDQQKLRSLLDLT